MTIVPPLGVVGYVRQARRPLAELMQAGGGPREALKQCKSIVHPFAVAPPLDLLLEGCERVALLPSDAVVQKRWEELARWSRMSESL